MCIALSIKKIIGLLACVLLIGIAPIHAAEGSSDATKPVEVFMNSNALNSTVTLMVNDEVVSGPGNRVLANLEAGESFQVETSAAEGSEVMRYVIQVRYNDGIVSDLAPTAEDGNIYTYQIPENAQNIAGAVYFGDPLSEDITVADTFVNESQSTALNDASANTGTDNQLSDERAEETVNTEGNDNAIENALPDVTEVEPISPQTGGKQMSWWALFGALFIASVFTLVYILRNDKKKI